MESIPGPHEHLKIRALFCLDNSSFLSALEEGGLVHISRCVPEDDGYHLQGALVVALDLLRKVVDEMCDDPIFIVSPITRYIRGPCCNAEDHV